MKVTKLVLGPWLGHGSLWGLAHLALYSSLTFLSLASHATAMLTNPGAVPSDAQPLPAEAAALEEQGGWRKRRFCSRCKAFKPARAHHDSVTGRCVVKLDHFCPWVNNAVGVFNHKFFLLFVLYTFLQCTYSLLLVLSRFVLCAHAADALGCSSLGVLTALVMLEAILFGLFTLCMLCDQCAVLTTNETKIDRLKGERHAAPTVVNEIFGEASSRGRLCTYATWLLPLRVKFPGEVKREVLGFVVPPRGSGFDPKRIIDLGVCGDEMERGEAGGQRGEEGAELQTHD